MEKFQSLDKGHKNRMNQVELGMLLQEMGFIPMTRTAKDKELIASLWEILQGEKWGGVYRANLQISLKAVLNMEPKSSPIKPGEEPTEGILQLDDMQKQQFHKVFYSFYLKYRYQKTLTKSPTSPIIDPDFRPKINPMSERLASAAKGSAITSLHFFSIERRSSAKQLIAPRTVSPQLKKSPDNDPSPHAVSPESKRPPGRVQSPKITVSPRVSKFSPTNPFNKK